MDLANDLLDKGFIIMSSTPLRRKMEHGIRNLPTWIGRNRIQIEKKDFLEFWKATCSGITSRVMEALPADGMPEK